MNLISTMSFLFKRYSFVEVIYLLIRSNMTKFFLLNTNYFDTKDVNDQHTHTHTHTKQSEKDNTGKV